MPSKDKDKPIDSDEGSGSLASELMDPVEEHSDWIDHDTKGKRLSPKEGTSEDQKSPEQPEEAAGGEPEMGDEAGGPQELDQGQAEPEEAQVASPEEAQAGPEEAQAGPEEEPQQEEMGEEPEDEMEEGDEEEFIPHVVSDPPAKYPHEQHFSEWLHQHPLHEGEAEWEGAKQMGFNEMHDPDESEHEEHFHEQEPDQQPGASDLGPEGEEPPQPGAEEPGGGEGPEAGRDERPPEEPEENPEDYLDSWKGSGTGLQKPAAPVERPK